MVNVQNRQYRIIMDYCGDIGRIVFNNFKSRNFLSFRVFEIWVLLAQLTPNKNVKHCIFNIYFLKSLCVKKENKNIGNDFR